MLNVIGGFIPDPCASSSAFRFLHFAERLWIVIEEFSCWACDFIDQPVGVHVIGCCCCPQRMHRNRDYLPMP